MVRVPAWTVPLWILAAVGVVCGIAFWMWFRNRPEQMPAVSIAEREQIVEGRRDVVSQSAKVPATALFRSRSAWALCIMYGCVGFAGNFTTNLLPVYLQDDRHFSAATCAWIMGIPLGFGIVSCALGGFLSDWIAQRWGSRKWGRRLNGCVGLACAGIGIVAVPWAEPVWLVAWLLGISFFCNDLNMAPAWAACADVGEQHAGTLSGTMNMVGNLAGAAALAFAGWMLEGGASRLLFFTFGCSYVLAALCWFAIDVTKPVGFGHNRLPCMVESDATSPLQNENVE
jgi:nitrate/nitrite transporter NarK